nr:MAG TPA: hypothetical protein [Caudoviricetes sp.]
MWKRSGGGIIALIWGIKRENKYPRNLDKNRESHYLLL